MLPCENFVAYVSVCVPYSIICTLVGLFCINMFEESLGSVKLSSCSGDVPYCLRYKKILGEFSWIIVASVYNFVCVSPNGFGGLGVACWPLVPKFAGSNLAEAVGFLGRKNPQHAFLRRGS